MEGPTVELTSSMTLSKVHSGSKTLFVQVTLKSSNPSCRHSLRSVSENNFAIHIFNFPVKYLSNTLAT